LPESSDGFFEPPLELFSLEKKRPSGLPDGLFMILVFRAKLLKTIPRAGNGIWSRGVLFAVHYSSLGGSTNPRLFNANPQ